MGERVFAPASGSVLRILVSAGSVVSEGDEIAILEFMKMEIPIEAPRSGTVTRLLIREGASVEQGDSVAVIG